MIQPYDLNTALAAVDRYALRRARPASRLILIAGVKSVRSGFELDVEPARQRLEECLFLVMAAAHARAKEVYSKWQASSSDSKEVKRLLARATKTEKDALRGLFGSVAKSLTDKTMSRVRNEMTATIAGLAGGKKGYRNKLKQSMRSLGIDQNDEETAHLVKTVTRTAASLGFNAAAWVESEDDGLWGYEYKTAGDERVRDSHAALDGVRYPRNHAFWERFAPPNGWNCRCGLNPIYKGERTARAKTYRGTPDVDPEFLFNPGKIFAAD